jgi:glycosyltransferase involved in cell wall biosynthesis
VKIAIVHDWLTVYAGAERVLEELLRLYPDADLFSLIDYLPESQRAFLGGRVPRTSFLQRFPFVKRHYRRYLPLMPTAVERFDLTGYDLVLSTSNAVSKGVLTHPDQLHICYLQGRNLKYAYEDRWNYPGGRLRRLLADLALTRLRLWDSVAARRPDITIANSHYVSRWHRHRHGIPSQVIYPPVDVEFYSSHYREEKEPYYVTVGRLEPYKRMDVLVEAFRTISARLLIIGEGTQLATLRGRATPNIEFLGYCDRTEVARVISRARAFVFASREDFGIAPVEAQASGTPVIALGQGGSRETIRGLEHSRPTGVFFDQQTVPAVQRALREFESEHERVLPSACREHARQFGAERFRREFEDTVQSSYQSFQNAARIALD